MAKSKIKEYTQKEMQYIKNVGYTDEDVALLIGRTVDAVRAKRYSLGNPDKMREKNKKSKEKVRQKEVERFGGRQYDFWTKEEELMVLRSKKTDQELSEMLGRTINSIQKKRHRLLNNKKKGKKK